MAEAKWWQTAVVYEITMPSFQDSNGDGWGDLPGLTQRLDYLRDLGIDVVWLTPINESPMYDLGYDVSCYTRVDPSFGTFDDFDRLLREAKQRELRVVLDFVPNHTSVQHPWFLESSSSRDNARRDWYLWADPGPDGGPPNNWVDRFGKSAWTWNETSGQFYLGSFTPQQPDLNWRNPEVRQALYQAMRYWLDRGVDGLRIDALPHLIKDQKLRDNPPNLSFDENAEPSTKVALVYHQNQPELLEVIAELRAVMDEYDDRVLLGEVYQSPEQITAYQNAGAHLLLSTSMLQTTFEANALRHIVDLFEARTAVGAWPAHSSGNHDIGRVADRVAAENLRLAAMLHLSVRGTPTIYYGEELGLRKVDVPVELARDPSARETPSFGRDGYRAPMPWNRDAFAGFSTVEPWLPQDDATRAGNVEAQIADPGSILNFYRNMLRFRRSQPLLQSGEYAPLHTPDSIFAYVRGEKTSGLLVVLNIAEGDCEFRLQDYFGPTVCSKILFSTTFRDDNHCTTSLCLGPREGVIAQLQEASS